MALLFSRIATGRSLARCADDKLSVLFAILFAAIVLGETLTWHHWLGGGLVLTGAVILAFK